ncbi:MAG TPA: aminotransferase class V-fold PLP-dependent enzyme [Candidatus Scybalocola faecipullorum]|nr:aminotransferase class V-fold PLP-dependent enzyme [Candidatus Scybalocola faecipullorum]
MLYFDFAATSFPKPKAVLCACTTAMETMGNPGRGAYALSVHALKQLFETRAAAAALINAEDPMRIGFTQNATMALNEAIAQIDGEIVTTAMEHNSVLRPCYARGGVRVVPAPKGRLRAEDVINAVGKQTAAVIMTHASNVTGEIYDVEKVGAFCRDRGIYFIVDAAQTAGCVPVDVQKMKADMLAFSGHKGTFGPTGTGILYVGSRVHKVRPLLSGGTGSQSYELHQPDTFPDVLEAGTQNVHGITGLKAGIEYVLEAGVENICAHDQALAALFIREVSAIDGAVIYRRDCRRTGTVPVNFDGVSADDLCEALAERGICVRAGAHCAPLAHRSLGTSQTGVVRFSFGWTTSEADVLEGVRILKELLGTQA